MPGTVLNALHFLPNLVPQCRISMTIINRDMIPVGQGAEQDRIPKIRQLKTLQKTVNACRPKIQRISKMEDPQSIDKDSVRDVQR